MSFLKSQILIAALLMTVAGKPELREEPFCVPDSPERHGEIGCSIVEKKALPAGFKDPAFWHIDRFESQPLAQAGAGPASVVFQAHGSWWLTSVGPESEDHHGGQHVAQMKLSPLPEASEYGMVVLSAYIPAGMTSRVHFHSGVEAFYTVDGEQCLQTPKRAFKLRKGDSLVVPAGVTMRLIATGPDPRRAIAVIVHDASKPQTTRLPMEKASELASCDE